mmetsp:Transcript_10598/g.65346  ORF Transcript_10598/g.65346 Transcript_10598/m.65346 type:complete len:267 (-) Transcript_10598:205-1005(-)
MDLLHLLRQRGIPDALPWDHEDMACLHPSARSGCHHRSLDVGASIVLAFLSIGFFFPFRHLALPQLQWPSDFLDPSPRVSSPHCLRPFDPWLPRVFPARLGAGVHLRVGTPIQLRARSSLLLPRHVSSTSFPISSRSRLRLASRAARRRSTWLRVSRNLLLPFPAARRLVWRRGSAAVAPLACIELRRVFPRLLAPFDRRIFRFVRLLGPAAAPASARWRRLLLAAPFQALFLEARVRIASAALLLAPLSSLRLSDAPRPPAIRPR